MDFFKDEDIIWHRIEHMPKNLTAKEWYQEIFSEVDLGIYDAFVSALIDYDGDASFTGQAYPDGTNDFEYSVEGAFLDYPSLHQVLIKVLGRDDVAGFADHCMEWLGGYEHYEHTYC